MQVTGCAKWWHIRGYVLGGCTSETASMARSAHAAAAPAWEGPPVHQAALVEVVHRAAQLVHRPDALRILRPSCQLGGSSQPLLKQHIRPQLTAD